MHLMSNCKLNSSWLSPQHNIEVSKERTTKYIHMGGLPYTERQSCENVDVTGIIFTTILTTMSKLLQSPIYPLMLIILKTFSNYQISIIKKHKCINIPSNNVSYMDKCSYKFKYLSNKNKTDFYCSIIVTAHNNKYCC